MESQDKQTAMDLANNSPPKIKTSRWAYLLVAYGIWMMVFYSLSPMSQAQVQPKPARVAMQLTPICLR